MSIPNVMRETTSLNSGDCFAMFSRVKEKFDFPLHYHNEYELNLIINAKGAKRIVGDTIEIIDDIELVFIGPNVYHGWFTHQCTTRAINEVTIQFHKDLFDEKFLQRNQLFFIKNLLENAQRGIVFSYETTRDITTRILNLNNKDGFNSVLELISILHTLSLSKNMRILSDLGFSGESFQFASRRVDKVFEFMKSNYDKQLTLAEVAQVANMPEASFCRFLKKRTGKSFIESLNEIRVGNASRMLISTTHSIAEIAYQSGFNNISNFNRIFKRNKLCVPKEFRREYTAG
ncbi:AraC family transcriptional regulator [Mucilaginibacter sp. FT3.2]|uniref:AraC family transcriptional regulator n=1 Tax=Mucilaginibacter sp. FT3.2 TaxID=2723090 RepID=UPI00160718AE|nr:AraC family transcriptional regulator [Mucilaginibacter sp. FT3.2]MBB6232117.1 AraC-like DNA-binding protein [Mucilaginibacter sp. FT3.2]